MERDPAQIPDDELHDEAVVLADRAICCRACKHPVGREDDVFAPLGGVTVQVFANPGGYVFEVLTLRTADILARGPLTPGFSWFPGYGWRYALCSGCGSFLGWRYERMLGAGPPSFVGLDLAKVVRE